MTTSGRRGHTFAIQNLDQRYVASALRLPTEEFGAGDGMKVDNQLVVGLGERGPAGQAAPFDDGAHRGQTSRGVAHSLQRFHIRPAQLPSSPAEHHGAAHGDPR